MAGLGIILSLMLLAAYGVIARCGASRGPELEPWKPFYPIHHPSKRAPPSRVIKAAYWPSSDEFPASSIDTSYFNHIYYAFLLPKPTTFRLNVTASDQTKLPVFTGTLQKQKPAVKTLLSIGGGGSDPNVFSRMANSSETRAAFINSTIEVARKYGFDGVDLDWEFPADEQDMSNLALLYKEWRKALADESKRCGFGTPRSYPSRAIRKHVDWVSPMCFDYHGSWENFTGEQSALYDSKSNISTSYGISSWIRAGVPPRKLVMGLPLYGRTWTLQNPNVNEVGAPAVGTGPGDGVLTYSQIVDFNLQNHTTVKFDEESVSYYSYVGVSWIGYDDVQSAQRKVRFARSQGLGGYFFWALGQDKNWIISRQGTIEITFYSSDDPDT
ncbi:hypothetical protein NL676_035171 [Syzygium grande]|nr:hypothetical protein NL676_035171 [Syzygium grande]